MDIEKLREFAHPPQPYIFANPHGRKEKNNFLDKNPQQVSACGDE